MGITYDREKKDGFSHGEINWIGSIGSEGRQLDGIKSKTIGSILI